MTTAAPAGRMPLDPLDWLLDRGFMLDRRLVSNARDLQDGWSGSGQAMAAALRKAGCESKTTRRSFQGERRQFTTWQGIGRDPVPVLEKLIAVCNGDMPTVVRLAELRTGQPTWVLRQFAESLSEL